VKTYTFASLVLVVAVGSAGLVTAQVATRPAPLTLDPNEIPLPEIKTSLGTMPGPDGLPERRELPPVLTMNDGKPVSTPQQWDARRQEMRTVLEYYAVGLAPPAPGNVKGTELRSQLVANGKYKYRLIHLTFGPEEKLSLDLGLWTPADGRPVGVILNQGGSPPGATPLPRLPNGPNQGRGQDVLSPPLPTEPPVPAPMGRGGARGGPGGAGDPESIAANSPVLAHGYAYALFNPNDCAEDTTIRFPDGSFGFRHTRFPAAYPHYDWGVLRAWAWGASRVVDYLVTDPAIEKTQIAITGVSRNGKSALIAGAFDDRITLVAPVASSGGGTPAYRFSGAEHGGNEGLSEMTRKYPNWFAPHLHDFFGQAYKLPFDNHWFIALCAPRAFIALEGTNDQNVNKLGVRQSMLGAKPAFDLLNASDHLGVNWAERPHGMVQGDWDALLAFADKHWLKKPVERSFEQYPPAAYSENQPLPQ
jgi:hypothetical protein